MINDVQLNKLAAGRRRARGMPSGGITLPMTRACHPAPPWAAACRSAGSMTATVMNLDTTVVTLRRVQTPSLM